MHNDEFRIAVLFIQAKVKQPSQDVYAVVNKDKGDSATGNQTVKKYLCITLYVYGYSCYAKLKFIACGNTYISMYIRRLFIMKYSPYVLKKFSYPQIKL